MSDKYGVPALLVFLGIGIIFGSDVLNIVFFDDFQMAQNIGIIALIYILFSGGLDTKWGKVIPVAIPGLMLSTVGVLVSAVIVGIVAVFVLGISIEEGILFGAIVSSTDAAAVFSVLRSRAIGLKYKLRELIEFESGTNDPMAIFLTVGLIEYILNPGLRWFEFLGLFVMQMGIGLVLGLVLGKAITWMINNINLGFDGLYPVMALTFVPLIYAITDFAGGSGFLAVYLAGLVLGNSIFVHQRSLMNFFDGIGWLMQIVMFLALGLLVFPKEIFAVSGIGLLLAGTLIFVARPISIFVALFGSGLKSRAKLMVAWTGLRGATPIILGTFPLVAGLPNAELFFSIIFFVVISSVIVQAPTLPWMAKFLHTDSPIKTVVRYPIELEPSVDTKTALKEIELDPKDEAVGKQVLELGLPPNVLITLINREGKFIVPRGTTVLLENDKLLILTDRADLTEIRRLIKYGVVSI